MQKWVEYIFKNSSRVTTFCDCYLLQGYYYNFGKREEGSYKCIIYHKYDDIFHVEINLNHNAIRHTFSCDIDRVVMPEEFKYIDSNLPDDFCDIHSLDDEMLESVLGYELKV